MKSGFWKGKRVLVTGISGFVGSALAAHLVEKGAKVTGIVRDDAKKIYFDHSDLSKKVTAVRGDLVDPKLVLRVLKKQRIQVVYHLAAQAIVGLANKEPFSTFETNVRGTWNLLEACRLYGKLEALIVASSDKSYGTHKVLPYKETFALRPEFPYDTSKACADLIAGSYYRTFGLPVVITRFANIYGPGDMNFSRIVPDTLRSVLQGKAPVIRSDGTPERDYLYVEDVADLYLKLAENIKKTKGEIFNAGHNKPVSVIDLVKAILKAAGRTDLKPQILGKGSLHGEIDRQWLDGAKAFKVLRWKPKTDLQTGLRKTIAWYKRVPNA